MSPFSFAFYFIASAYFSPVCSKQACLTSPTLQTWVGFGNVTLCFTFSRIAVLVVDVHTQQKVLPLSFLLHSLPLLPCFLPSDSSTLSLSLSSLSFPFFLSSTYHSSSSGLPIRHIHFATGSQVGFYGLFHHYTFAYSFYWVLVLVPCTLPVRALARWMVGRAGACAWPVGGCLRLRPLPTPDLPCARLAFLGKKTLLSSWSMPDTLIPTPKPFLPLYEP